MRVSVVAVDTRSARWSTSLHEAGHLVALHVLGGVGAAVIDESGRTGRYDGEMPDRATATDRAVVHLAGGAAQRLLYGRDGESHSDTRQARGELHRTGVSLRAARRDAEALIRAHRRAVDRLAVTLYQDGQAAL